MPTAKVVRPVFPNTFPAFVIGDHVSPRSTDMYKLLGPKPANPPNSCTEASQPTLVLTKLQTHFPGSVLTGTKLFPPSADRNNPASVPARTTSRFGLIGSTFTSNTLVASGRLKGSDQVWPLSVDLTMNPPGASKGSPVPRYSVL